MGVALRFLPLAVIAAFLVGGCANHISAQTVREKDNWRRETSKRMPGNNIPMDPSGRSLIQTEACGRSATKSLYRSRSPAGTGTNLRALSTLIT